jgi:single stranded DNA-binding protein
MALPLISFTGNLTQDIEVFVTKNGKSGAKIKVACNDRKKVGNDWVDGDTIFLTGVVWGDTAENSVITLSKGDTVTCTGKLTQRSYTGKDNQEKTVYEVNIDSLAADLRRTPYNKLGVTRVTAAPLQQMDAWSAPLSDNNTGVNF